MSHDKRESDTNRHTRTAATRTQHSCTQQRARATYIYNKRISEIRPSTTHTRSFRAVSPTFRHGALAAASIPVAEADVGR